MAWSGNLRCLHCDGKLPLYRKLTSGQFCSKAHSDAYWQEQERLAVERLHQTHDSLRAYRAPADTLEAILGKPAASEPVSSAHYYQSDDVAAAERVQPELEVSDMARSAANTGNVTFAGFVVEEKPGLRAWDAIRAAWNGEFMLWPMSRPAIPQSAGEKQDYTLGAVSAVPMPRFLACGFASVIRTEAGKSGAVEFAGKPVIQIPLGFVPEPVDLSQLLPEVVPEVVENLPPFAESLMALEKFGAQAVLPAFGAHVSEPIETALRAQNTRLDATFATPAVVAVTQLEPLTLSNAPKALAARAGAAGDAQPGDLRGYAQPMEWKASSGAPWMNLAIPAAGPAMSLAPGSRYAIFDGIGAAPKANVETLASPEALELRDATASPSTQLASQSVALSLNTAPGCRYGVAMQSGPVQVLANATEIEPVPAPRKQLPVQGIEIGLQTAPPIALAVASQPGTLAPLASVTEIEVVSAPRKQLSAQTHEMGLQTAPPSALELASQAGSAAPPLQNVDALAAKAQIQIVPLPDGLGRAQQNPLRAKVLPLAFRAKAIAPPAATPVSTSVEHVYASNTPLNPQTKFEPIE